MMADLIATLAEHMRWPQAHTLNDQEAAMWKVRRDELYEEIARLKTRIDA
jgi:hypothetical protein